MNEIIASNEVSSGIGLMVGPAVGAGFYFLTGYQGMFNMLSVIFVTGAVVVYVFVGKDTPYVIVDEEGKNNVSSLLKRKEILVNCFPFVYAMAEAGFCDAVIAPHLAIFGFAPPEIGILWALSDCGYVIFSLVIANSVHRFELKRVNLVALGIVSMSYWLLGPWELLLPRFSFFTVAGQTILAAVLAMLNITILPTLLNVAVSELDLTKDDILIDSLAGIASGAAYLGEVLGPLIAGVTVDFVGVSEAGGIVGCAGFFFCGIFYLLTMKVKPHLLLPRD